MTKIEVFDGDGLTSTFSLSSPPVVGTDPRISVQGITQTPGQGYTVSGVAIEFSWVPQSGDEIVCWYQGV